MKLWDARSPRGPVKLWSNLFSDYQGCSMALSPDERYILTGVNYNRAKDTPAALKFFDFKSHEEKVSLDMGELGVGAVQWHSNMNQIFVGLTDGSILALFDPVISNQGVKSCLVK
jgi:WD40 repeat protein